MQFVRCLKAVYNLGIAHNESLWLRHHVLRHDRDPVIKPPEIFRSLLHKSHLDRAIHGGVTTIVTHVGLEQLEFEFTCIICDEFVVVVEANQANYRVAKVRA